MLTLTIHRRLTQDVVDLAEASSTYGLARDLSGEGASTFPQGVVTDETGMVVAFVSYNAKVWEDDPCRRNWKPGSTPLYNPYEQAA